MLRTLGADVVGMSTVPEAIVARHANMDVLAFALVTNAAAGASDVPISHEDVLAMGRGAVPKLGGLIEGGSSTDLKRMHFMNARADVPCTT